MTTVCSIFQTTTTDGWMDEWMDEQTSERNEQARKQASKQAGKRLLPALHHQLAASVNQIDCRWPVNRPDIE